MQYQNHDPYAKKDPYHNPNAYQKKDRPQNQGKAKLYPFYLILAAALGTFLAWRY